MAPKPSDKPNWIPDDTTGIVPPGTSKQSAGWFKEERPPYQFFNWFWNRVCQWIDYLSGNVKHNIIIDTDTNERDYTTLAAYIADSPTAGDRVLVKVDEEITGSTMVIPANIQLEFLKGKKLWCDENLTTVLQFGDGVVTRGDLLLELSHTGTVTTAVSLNGDSNSHANIIVKNTTTGTITSVFKLEAGADGNEVKGELLNPSGTVTNTVVGNTNDGNDISIRESGGDLISSQRSRTAALNRSDSPAPDVYGGGTIWAEFRTTGTTEIVIDDSIDWRDRFITYCGYANEDATSNLPGTTGDNVLDAYSACNASSADSVLVRIALSFAYSEAGSDGSANPRVPIQAEDGTDIGYVYAKSSNGNLAFKFPSAPTNEWDVVLRIDYSPKQNHY